ncbi:MAG: hypothetical protein ACJAXM_000399 [Arenicella sp.]|jgi:hypothetical protein
MAYFDSIVSIINTAQYITFDLAMLKTIGSISNNASNPNDGIALDEKFRDRFNVAANLLTIKLIQNGRENIVADLGMRVVCLMKAANLHFKVDAYNLNNTIEAENTLTLRFMKFIRLTQGMWIANTNSGLISHF